MGIFRSRNIGKRDQALYLWAFVEAHAWGDVGGGPDESFDSIVMTIRRVLTEMEEEQILRWCVEPPPQAETTAAIVRAAVPDVPKPDGQAGHAPDGVPEHAQTLAATDDSSVWAKEEPEPVSTYDEILDRMLRIQKSLPERSRALIKLLKTLVDGSLDVQLIEDAKQALEELTKIAGQLQRRCDTRRVSRSNCRSLVGGFV